MEILREVRGRYGFALIGYVIMPEHMHLLISESASLKPEKVIQIFKQRVFAPVARQEARGERAVGAGISGGRQWAAAILAAALF